MRSPPAPSAPRARPRGPARARCPARRGRRARASAPASKPAIACGSARVLRRGSARPARGCPRGRSRSGGIADLDRVEPEEQVLAEAAGRDLLRAGRRWWRRGCARPTRRVREEPTRSNSPVSSTRSSLACRLEGHVRDLVEEERAAVGQLEAADAVGLGVGEGALHVAEQLALEDALGQPARVHADERPRRARRGGVQRARDHALARAVLAGDQHVGVGGPTRAIMLQHRLHRRRLGDQRRPAPPPRSARFSASSRWPRRSAPRQLDLRAQDGEQRARCPTASGTKSRAPRRIASTARSTLPQAVITTTGSVGSSACRRVEQVEALRARGGVARVVEVHQHDVELARLDRAPRQRGGRGRGLEVEALALEQQAQRLAARRAGRRRRGRGRAREELVAHTRSCYCGCRCHAVAEPHDAIAVGGVRLGVRDLHDRRALARSGAGTAP